MKKIFFSYVEPTKFSGQTAATLLIIDFLKERGYSCKTIKLYPLQRSIQSTARRWYNLLRKQIRTLPDILNLLFTKNPILHLTLGQGIMSFLRVAIWLFPVKVLRPGLKIISSLNGNVFMNWSKDDFKTRFFLLFLKNSSFVTVLGKKQKNKLVELGVEDERIRIVPNVSELFPVSKSFLKEKQYREEISILHLSLLIESKGFPEYLEAAQLLAEENPGRRIRFVLCGPVSFTSYCTRFKTAEEKTGWIEEKVKTINAINENLNVKWIRGARGKEKEQLFREAQIFVMPTTFPVEAQPLVLLEAMAGGCAIISTKVGEIESILNSKNAVLIDDTAPNTIAEKIRELIYNQDQRVELALEGLKDIEGPLSLENYGNSWEKMINEV